MLVWASQVWRVWPSWLDISFMAQRAVRRHQNARLIRLNERARDVWPFASADVSAVTLH